MTTYKEIFGKYVKNYSSDPSSDIEGQIWYNSTSGTFKSQVLVAAAWASGGNINTTRRNLAGFGTQTAGVIAGGFVPPSSTATEKYDGTTWTTSGSLPTAKESTLGGAGTQTAGIVAGGSGPDNGPAYSASTFEFNGSTWSPGGNLNQGGLSRRMVGTQTATLGTGGYIGGGNFTNATEEYDGTNWTTGGNFPGTPNTYQHGAGTQTAAVNSVPSGPTLGTFYYDGTSWTQASASGPPSGAFTGSGHQGSQTAFSTFGPTSTGLWNGTSWTTSANLSTSRSGGGDAGNSTSALYAAGYTGANTNVTEEFTGDTLTTKTITTS
jgi:hypothetical protein